MSSIVASVEHTNDSSKGYVSTLYFHNGYVLTVTSNLVCLYKDRTSVTDPFANGVIGVIDIPVDLSEQLANEHEPVVSVTSGCVHLKEGAVLLLKPLSVELYASSKEALHAQARLGMIDLPVL